MPEARRKGRGAAGEAGLRPTVGTPLRGRLPRGASSLPRAVVDAEQRKRLVIATARVVARKGYADATVGDIIAEAGVSRATFYQLFEDKESCFLYGFRKLAAAHLDETERRFSGTAPHAQRLADGVAAYLERVNVDHALARAFIAEAEGATPRIRRAFRKMQRRLCGALQRWFEEVRGAWPEIAPRSEADIALVVHGLTGHVIDHVRDNPAFDDAQASAILRFLLAGLGLHAWAEQLDRGASVFELARHPSD